MPRFYVETEEPSPVRCCLTPEDAHHALHVLRLGLEDSAELIVNSRRYQARITEISGGSVFLSLLSPLPSTEPGIAITLFQGLPKSDKMDWIVQKSVELGVSRIVPLHMARCVSKPDAKDAEKKAERWRKIAREAGKQSGRCIVPEVFSPFSAAQAASLLTEPEHVLVPWEQCPSPGPLGWVREHESVHSIGIVIGPEGGITPDEIQQFLHLGCEPVTLGRRILRTETAGIACISALLGLYGEMEG